MTLRQVWILNYGAAVTLLSFFSWTLLETIDLRTPDKDINTIYMVATIVIYLVFLSYHFYRTIYQWSMRRRLQFYLISFLTFVLSIIILAENVGAKDVNFSLGILSALVLCGIHVLTYSVGMLASNRMKASAPAERRL